MFLSGFLLIGLALGDETSSSKNLAPVTNELIRQKFGEETFFNIDDSKGSAHRIFLNGSAVTPDVRSHAEKMMATHTEIFRTPLEEIQLLVQQKVNHLDYLIFRQTVNRVPVYQSKMDFRYQNGKLVWFGADTYPDIALSTDPAIDAETAVFLAGSAVDFDHNSKNFISDKPELFIFAHAPGQYRLAWKLGLFVHHDDPDLYKRSVSNYLIWVDAQIGEVFSIFDRVEELEIQGFITGMVKDLPYGTATPRPLEDVKITVAGVGETYTDEAGYYVIEAGTTQRNVTVEFLGQFLNVNASNANDANVSAAVTPGDSFSVHFTNLNSLAGERDTYFHANVIHDWIKNIDSGFTGTDYVMPAAVNIGSEDNLWPCNAYWDGFGINMFSAGGGCNATDQMADVIYHEYEHGITQYAYDPLSPPYDSGMGEGFSDYAAMTLRNSPCLGDGFFGTPGECLRDGENTLQYPGNECGGGVHCLGQLSMGSLWQMRKNLINALGDTAQAVAHSDSLFRFALVGRPYTVPDLLIEILTADDNDGNIYNGTPNFQEIIAGFAQHNVPSPLPSFGIIHSPVQNMLSAEDPINIDAFIFSLDSDILTAEVVYTFGIQEISTAMTPGDENSEYTVLIPSQPPGSVIKYYIHAEDINGNEYFSPATAPEIQHFFLIGDPANFPALFTDNSEDENSWTLGMETDNATSGFWVREDPIGTTTNNQSVQPEDDHSSTGVIAYITGNAPFNGSNAGENDVDGGVTTLVTPAMNLLGAINPVFTYWRWYTNDLGNNPNADEWVVQITADGQNWVDLERTFLSDNQWVYKQFLIDQYISLSSTVQFRFIAADGGEGSLVEAAVDDVIVISGAGVDIMIGDVNFDGELSINDILQMVDYILGSQSPNGIQLFAGDVNSDGNLNIIDVLTLIQRILNH